jgi:hypothetical protein
MKSYRVSVDLEIQADDELEAVNLAGNIAQDAVERGEVEGFMTQTVTEIVDLLEHRYNPDYCAKCGGNGDCTMDPSA